jgi:hypothetical protein
MVKRWAAAENPVRVQSLKAVFRMRQSRKPQFSAVFECFRQRITRIDSEFLFPAVFRRKPAKTKNGLRIAAEAVESCLVKCD